MLAIEVPIKKTNDVRLFVLEKGFMSKDYKIKTDKKIAYIPIKDNFSSDCLEELQKKFSKNIKVVITDLEKIEKSPASLSEYLIDKLSKEEIENLKTSFDIIGDIVILEIPDSLLNHKKLIGESALKFTKRKTVYMKKSAIKGIIRTRDLELIAGEDNSITIHKEHGIKLSLDVKKVYFSPRLSSERKRIEEQVKDGEEILDMFAGIGPFSIVIAKEKKVKIIAIDINKEAIEYMNENIKLNNLKGEIIGINEDSQKYLENNPLNVDRIIMNLPGLAYEFLDIAISHLKKGGILHYYEFSSDFYQAIDRIKKASKDRNVEILNKRKVKSTKPGEWHIVVDAEIN